MGWSAFAGFAVLVAGWPLNNFLANRSVRINRGTLAARDARMGVLNELLSAMKFIKFFAWEDKWIARVMEARGKEIDWIVKCESDGNLETNSPIYRRDFSAYQLGTILYTVDDCAYPGLHYIILRVCHDWACPDLQHSFHGMSAL